MKAAVTSGLDATFLATVIFWESGGDSEVISQSNYSLGIIGGAVGLMQVMPRDGEAAKIMCPNGPCFASRPTIEELKDPLFNLEYGSDFLASLVNVYGMREGLFMYGPEGIGYGYADKILGLYEQITK